MIKTCLPSLVVVIVGLLSVARAVDVTGAYSYYPVNATVLHVDANEGSFNCPSSCTSYIKATGCTGMSKKQTDEICSRSFGATSAAAKLCTNIVKDKIKQFSCTGFDPASKFSCSGCTKIGS
ncbi:hypothetical protein PGT21_026236 [Puccinia graminis f. sp. tritici]|uniref:Secreted protein n=1 Tax=Puccinia graminis f. sp. tritici TaxID=56615 RepID=A0A5B0LMT6_PUCGR|nr:hypothetical protein PGT21_026236 [Puccinia graminis f. sp. tritici]KAA1072723.1 hypothetical protein PGTUg99_022593 [Puccinia graminis f. sp. tritici]